METVAAIYALIVAGLVVGLWAVSLALGRVPELASEPRAIRLHITAELGMAAVLAVAGAASLAGAGIGTDLLVLGFGAVLYSIVNSSGYYAQRGETGPLAMFLVLFIVTIGLAVSLLAAA